MRYLISIAVFSTLALAVNAQFNYLNYGPGQQPFGRQQGSENDNFECPTQELITDTPIRRRSYRGERQICCFNRHFTSCTCGGSLQCCPNNRGRLICIEPSKYATISTEAPLAVSTTEGSTSAPVTGAAPTSTAKAAPVEVMCSDLLSTAPELCDAMDAYRSIDGSCNNLNNPGWGQSKQPLRRQLTPEYATEDGKPRTTSVTGSQLPTPRKVSTTIHTLVPPTAMDPAFTHMNMLWGQYIDHDISLTPLTDQTVQCCDADGNHLDKMPSENCIPITVPEDDPSWNFTCMELVRSKAIPAGQCGITNREQINMLTPWIDGGTVYGNNDGALRQLRAYVGGRLRVGQNNTMPTRPAGSKCMIPKEDSDKACFLAGDNRVNVWSGLTGMHGTFVLEHNRIADRLHPIVRAKYPHYSMMKVDDVTYEETRRIVGAIHQVITYKEYLPGSLGPAAMNLYNLNLGNPRYSDTLDPQTANEFATAAFRFGHNEIPFATTPTDKTYTPTAQGSIILEDTFHQPSMFTKLGHDNIMRGLIVEPCKHADTKFTKTVRDNLFIKSSKNKAGLDLPAINNQRGRDHGIPAYIKYRQLCGLSVAHDFSNLEDFTPEIRQGLSEVYDDVNDIDLFTGGLSEIHVSGGRVGPLFACMLGDQFHRIKDGDRFWFENTVEYSHPFSTSQISQLSAYSLAKLICNNHDMDTVPTDVFNMLSERVPCSHIPDLDLESWLD